MRNIYTLTFILIVLNSFGQTAIQVAKCQLNYSFGSNSYGYDIKVPLFEDNGEQDKRKAINDSILLIVDHFKFALEEPSYNNNINDSKIYSNPEYYSIDYIVNLNTDKILSLNIISAHANGNGGHGGESYGDYFNLDIRNNQFITIDSLFNSKNKQNLSNYLEHIKPILIEKQNAEFLSDQDSINFFGVFGEGNFRFIGMSLDSNNIYLHYSIYMGGANTSIYDLTIPFKDIKKFINKKYLWICGTTLPK